VLKSYYSSIDNRFKLLHGNCLTLLNSFSFSFNSIFADPPYFLSNDGISVQSGNQVSVNNGTGHRALKLIMILITNG